MMPISLENIAFARQGPSESVWRLCVGVYRARGSVDISLDVFRARAPYRKAVHVLSKWLVETENSEAPALSNTL